jgi:hypothetical protein
MQDRGRDAIVRGLAAVAVSTAEGGGTEGAARLQFIQVLRAHGTADPSLVLAAAASVADRLSAPDALPGAQDDAEDDGLDPAEAQRVRTALGVPTEAEELTAMLVGREWLQSFAADLAR